MLMGRLQNRDKAVYTACCCGAVLRRWPVTIAAALSASALLAAPELAFPPEGIALGEFAAGEPASGALELRNAGDTPLHISGVRGCCGMGAELSSRTIPPGGSATLTVTLRPPPPGPVSNAVRIRCDDPARPSVEVCGLIFFNSDVSDCLANARRERSVSGVSDKSEFVSPNGSILHCPTPWDFGTMILLSGKI